VRPYDCKDIEDTKKMDCQGLTNGDWTMMFRPNSVTVSHGPIRLRIPMYHFKNWAKWFMEDNPKLDATP